MSESQKSKNYTRQLESMLARLDRLVRARFACTVNYVPLLDDHEDHQELRQLLARGGSVEREGSLYFPVYLAYQIVGAAEIVGQIPEAESERNQLSDLVELVLETAIASSDRLDLLAQMEDHIRNPHPTSLPINVIPLRKPLRPAFEDESLPAKSNRRVIVNVPCLIQSECLDDIKRLAQEIHDSSGRYAFVYWSDLELKSDEDLKALGPATVLINDLTKLSLKAQEILLRFLRVPRDRQCPQIIAGTTLTHSEMLAHPSLDSEVLQKLSVCRLRMTKPFDEYRRNGLMDFFFIGLVDSTTEPVLT